MRSNARSKRSHAGPRQERDAGQASRSVSVLWSWVDWPTLPIARLPAR
ncbi:hypothetical protein [Lysobacter gummosus]